MSIKNNFRWKNNLWVNTNKFIFQLLIWNDLPEKCVKLMSGFMNERIVKTCLLSLIIHETGTLKKLIYLSNKWKEHAKQISTFWGNFGGPKFSNVLNFLRWVTSFSTKYGVKKSEKSQILFVSYQKQLLDFNSVLHV